jgi:DNA-binding response OmpR family regulator
MRILVAEDSRTTQVLLQRLLTEWGHEVIMTGDGDEAWGALSANDPPRLAILDWLMPGMDGLEICRRVRKTDGDDPLYVIMLTAKTEKEDIVAGLEAGADDYVTKPFDGEELRARVGVGVRVLELQAALAGQVRELRDALAHIKTLQGIIPICMYCHKIRDDRDIWQRMEQYIAERSGAEFSHSLCPECREKHYPRHRGNGPGPRAG